MNRTLIALTVLLSATACGDDNTQVTSQQFDDVEVIQGYVDNVMVPKYDLHAQNASALSVAVDAFIAEPTQVRLEAAQEAWRAARAPWELSETSLFGPVDVHGYDPALDSWPLNLVDLNTVLGESGELSQADFEALDMSLKGFHAVELLLFGPDGTRDVTSLSARELSYLSLAAKDIAKVAGLLSTSWTGGDAPYATVFRTAGEQGNTTYPSRFSAAQEITTGMAGILDEVANGKIADPYNERDQTLVESPFSFNSKLDFANNVRGAKTAYLGDFELAQKDGRGLSDWVAERDSALDTRIQAEFDTAIAAIEAIPAPFRDSILDDASRPKIKAAIDAINVVKDSVESDLQPMLRGE